jgi:hypothetical protein
MMAAKKNSRDFRGLTQNNDLQGKHRDFIILSQLCSGV